MTYMALFADIYLNLRQQSGGQKLKNNKKWVKKLFRRRLIVALIILLQLAFVFLAIVYGSRYYSIVSSVLGLISLIVSLYILSNKSKSAFKLTWIFLILLFPLFGGLLYILFKFQSSTPKFEKRRKAISEQTTPLYTSHGYVPSDQATTDNHTPLMQYLERTAGFPAYENTEIKYLESGEAKFEALLRELRRAEKYIFLEYFIIQEGVMWDSILEILRQKVAEGVEVRVMYDDMGCFLLLPKNYAKTLRSYGIKCTVFNPFRPVFSAIQNNRDHRKIISIDGKVAFTGGINLADEYINVHRRFGHWRDSSIMMRGAAAWSMTLMFLEMWSTANGSNEDYAAYLPEVSPTEPAAGYVQPYCDTPMDTENVGEQVYLHILHRARKYIYICTPYLIADDNMMSALALAAKSGIDVRIITPHVPDKKIVHTTTRSYYPDLIDAGVRIYEYTPGFMHSKTFVSDDCIATVGTTNLDFRSLYLHFECGAVMYDCPAISDVKADFLKTLEVCEEISRPPHRNNLFARMWRAVLRLYAPLM